MRQVIHQQRLADLLLQSTKVCEHFLGMRGKTIEGYARDDRVERIERRAGQRKLDHRLGARLQQTQIERHTPLDLIGDKLCVAVLQTGG